MTPPLRLNRAPVNRLPPRTDEGGSALLKDPPPEFDEQNPADILACAVGRIGTKAEHLLDTVTERERHGIHNLYLWRLHELMARRLARLPEPVDTAPGPVPSGQAGHHDIPSAE